MEVDTIIPNKHRINEGSLPCLLLSRLPLVTFQPALNRVINKIIKDKPELFNRITTQKDKQILIDPINMPFVFLLRPDPQRPFLRAYKRHENFKYDARIAGSFLTLLNIIDGKLDGDALFFTRDLIIEGDTEAIVCLRNAMDDMEGSIAEDAVATYGLAGMVLLAVLRQIKPSLSDR